MYNKKELIEFEEDIADCFNKKMIKAPIHLYNGNEDAIIGIFDTVIKKEDWVMCSWRSHYQCLLHGVPKEELKQAILDGKSITLSFPKYKILSSAIVGGIIPIALGTALGIKRRNEKNKVVVFVGEMSSETGAFHESLKYSINYDLPIIFVIENNFKSVCTPTDKVWNNQNSWKSFSNKKIIYYEYTSKYPHAGGLNRIQF